MSEGAPAQEASGTLTASSIRKTITRKTSAFMACYKAELKLEPSLRGKVTVSMTIGRSGLIKEAHILKDELGSERLNQCLLSSVKTWRFDKPTGGDVTISYPFLFRPPTEQ